MTAVASDIPMAPDRGDPAPVVFARTVDEDRAAAAVSDLLDALGLDTRDDGLAETPRRVARMFAELLSPQPFRPTTFPNDAGYDELVMVSDIAFTALCEHHLLPFRGVAHVGYLPDEQIIGVSKLARLVEAFASRPQVQERLTAQIADWLRHHLGPRGVGVVVAAEHLCMSIRGVRSHGARTITSALHGRLREDPAARREFLDLARTGT